MLVEECDGAEGLFHRRQTAVFKFSYPDGDSVSLSGEPLKQVILATEIGASKSLRQVGRPAPDQVISLTAVETVREETSCFRHFYFDRTVHIRTYWIPFVSDLRSYNQRLGTIQIPYNYFSY